MQDGEPRATRHERARSHVGRAGDAALRRRAESCGRSPRCRAATRPAASISVGPRQHARALRAGVSVEPGCRRQGRVARSAPVCGRHCVLHAARRHAGVDRHAARSDRRSEQLLLPHRQRRRRTQCSASKRACAGGCPSSSKSARASGCCTRAIPAIVPKASTSAIAIRRMRRSIRRRVNATWRHPLGWMARVDVAAIDDYYFDVPPNDQRAAAYSLTQLKAGYEADRWSVYCGAATCSTRSTSCAASTSATSRRTVREHALHAARRAAAGRREREMGVLMSDARATGYWLRATSQSGASPCTS